MNHSRWRVAGIVLTVGPLYSIATSGWFFSATTGSAAITSLLLAVLAYAGIVGTLRRGGVSLDGTSDTSTAAWPWQTGIGFGYLLLSVSFTLALAQELRNVLYAHVGVNLSPLLVFGVVAVSLWLLSTLSSEVAWRVLAGVGGLSLLLALIVVVVLLFGGDVVSNHWKVVQPSGLTALEVVRGVGLGVTFLLGAEFLVTLTALGDRGSRRISLYAVWALGASLVILDFGLRLGADPFTNPMQSFELVAEKYVGHGYAVAVGAAVVLQIAVMALGFAFAARTVLAKVSVRSFRITQGVTLLATQLAVVVVPLVVMATADLLPASSGVVMLASQWQYFGINQVFLASSSLGGVLVLSVLALLCLQGANRVATNRERYLEYLPPILGFVGAAFGVWSYFAPATRAWQHPVLLTLFVAAFVGSVYAVNRRTKN